jgi:hypothetical protein
MEKPVAQPRAGHPSGGGWSKRGLNRGAGHMTGDKSGQKQGGEKALSALWKLGFEGDSASKFSI